MVSLNNKLKQPKEWLCSACVCIPVKSRHRTEGRGDLRTPIRQRKINGAENDCFQGNLISFEALR
ncbi:hypothetical protein Tcan_07918 [Toxocara canis]|uniref:Uncharacterized protein n=1 Tax=Toxocara canis TaxID=6265 RepID=A0A0B2VND8_TOXCA|nr:hypothetical protein Tcan_07918 [Toxocara canis]